MKSIYLYLLFIIICNAGWSQWNYSERERILYFENQPFPPYSPILTPVGSFVFIPFASNPFDRSGWFPVKEFKIEHAAGGPVEEKELKRGWVISNTKPQNVPQNWVYFPQSSLWSDPRTFFKLYRLWNRFFETLPILEPSIYNEIEPNKFYRIQTPYLDKEIQKVELTVPEDIIVVFKKDLISYGKRKLFLIYTLKAMEKNPVSVLKLFHHYKNGQEKTTRIKLVYQKDTGLNFQSY
jgi:hypothetical protein